jgi:membrane-bound lytic murein transglycosylase A
MTYRHLALWFALLIFTGCQNLEPGIGMAVEFKDLPGWNEDQHAQAFTALDKGCIRLAKKPDWQAICTSAMRLGKPGDEEAKIFFEAHFTPHTLRGEKGTTRGMITGYYEPLLHGAMQADERYRYPLYKTPEDMLIVDLGAMYPSLKGKRVRGRVVGNKVLPYYSRAQIDGEKIPLSGQELLWVDDRDQLFFLQIQGSGRVQLPDGKIIGAGYANQNGHAYISIGKKLIDMGELKREDVSLFSIKDWLKANPQRARALLNENPSYVFFVLREKPESGPTGSLNVPLTAERSLAIDPKFVELGLPIWLSTTYPGETQQPLQKLVMAQDTGGAIKGQLRADLFWGTGERAEAMAGNMKQPGELFILLPNDKTVAESNSKD